MNHLMPTPRSRNMKALIASLISYLMLVGPMVPMAAAAGGRARASAKPEAAAPATENNAAAPVPAPLAFAPDISATKVDAHAPGGDLNSNGLFDPGDTIRYTVTLTNNGTTAATGVTFTDNVDTNTSLVAGSTSTQPIAFNDTYTAWGNVRITHAAAAGLIANDRDPDVGNGTSSGLTVTAIGTDTTSPFSFTTANGGEVTSSATDGSFAYNPAPGYEGADTFSYTVTDAQGKTDTATAQVTVGTTLIWFINNDPGAPAGNDGRITSPFNSIAAYNASLPTKDADDIVFIYQGTSAYTGSLTLTANMKLIGQGYTLQTETGAPPAGSETLPAAAANPVVNSIAGNTVTLATNNTVRGLTLNDTVAGGIDLAGSTFGTLTVSNVTISGTGRPLSLHDGTLAATFDSLNSTGSSGGQGILLSSVGGSLVSTGGTGITDPATQCILVTGSTANVNFGNTTCSDATDGISLQNNASGTRTFGSLTVANGSAAAFLHGAGGGTTVVGATTITNPGTNGVSVANSTTPVSFGNTSITLSGAAGVSYTGSNGNLSFGDLDIGPDSSQQAISTNGNAGTISSTSGTISTSGAAALNLLSTVLGLAFDSVSAANNGSASNGINIVGGSGTVSASAGTIAGGTNPAVVVNGGSASLTYNGGISQSNNAALLSVLGGHTGNLTFNTGTLSATNGTGLQFDNADGAYNFNGTTTMNGGDAGVDITNGSGGAFSFSNATSITNASGTDFLVNGGGGNVTYNGTITDDDGQLISISNTTGGTKSFTGAITDGDDGDGGGISLATNTGATITFSGGLTLNTGANPAFAATGGGTVNATQNNVAIVNKLTTTTGTALNVANTNIGSGGLTFRSISSNGATNGIVLNNTGSAGGLTVTGNSSGLCGGQVVGVPATVTAPNAADCTGGVIQSSTGAGILLTNTSSVSLTRVRVANGGNDGVFGTNVTGFTLASSLIENNGNAVEEANLDFAELHGTSSVTNSVIRLAHENNVEVRNTTNNGSQSTLSITGSTINNASSKTQSVDGVLYEGSGTANMSVTVSGCALFANRGDHLQAAGNGTADMAVVFQNNTLTGGHSTAQGQDIVLNTGATASGASFTYDVNGNNINGAILSAITVTLGTPSIGVTMSGRIRNNTIGTSGVSESGSVQANGITLNQTGGGTLTSAITGNTIRQWEQRGISASAFDASGTMNLTIQSNTILEGNAVDPVSMVGGREAIIIIAGSSAAGNTNVVCAQIGGAGALANNVNRGPEAVISGEQDIRVRARSAATFRLPGYGGSASDTTAVQNFIAAQNTSSVDGVVGVVADKDATSPGYVGGAACATPAAADEITGTNPDSGDGDANAESEATEPAASGMGGVTSQPFVSMPRAQGATAASAPAPSTQAGAGTPAMLGGGGDADEEAAPASAFNSVGAPLGSGGNVNVNVGTLNPGDSVVITFDVVIDTPFTANPKQVSNQGMVSYGPGGLSELTDDPSTGAANDPTVTPIVVPPDIFVRDAKVAEPSSGSADMVFTVALSGPATSALTVNFTTADEPAGPGKAVAGTDYTTTTGAVVFAIGQQIKTISVPVLPDGDAEPDETFLVNLTSAVGGYTSIADSQATGTITGPEGPGAVLITEMRTSGPSGPGDDFVEVYNNSDTPLNVGPTGWALVASNNGCLGDPVVVGVIPSGTTIPARGHYLFVGSQYSLANYGGALAASGDQTMTADLAPDANVALFATDTLIDISSINRRDAVGFGTNTGNICGLMREGATLLEALGSTTSQYSFVRKVTLVAVNVPTPTDDNANATDFYVVSTTPAVPVSVNITAPALGTPGPENLASPTVKKFSQVGAQMLDPAVAASVAPNRVRKQCAAPAEECLPNRSSQGTISIRRRFVNTTGGPITRLRFRVYLVSTLNNPAGGTADLRAITSAPTTATLTGGGTVTVQGTTVEMYPTQVPTDLGGGMNSSMAVSSGVISTGTPLLDGAAVNVQFLFGVQQGGTFNVLVHVEALP